MKERSKPAVAAGGAVTLSELAAFLRPFCAELAGILRSLLSREAFMALVRGIISVGTRLSAFLGGTACGAPLAFLWYFLAIAAAGIGIAIGRLIGNITIGGQAIDDHLTDFFYWLFCGLPQDCEETYAAYTQEMRRFR